VEQDQQKSEELAAWHELCTRMSRLGERLTDPAYPSSALDRAKGISHLAEQAVCWLAWAGFHADPRRPQFHRQNDLILSYAGPNADNVYRHARIDAGRRYRIAGQMNSAEELVLAIRAGYMHQQPWGTLAHITGSELGISEGDSFELLLGPDSNDEPHYITIPAGAALASIREYYLHWRPEQPATITIECLDDDAAAPTPRPDGATVAAQLRAAGDVLEESIEHWNRYMNDYRVGGKDNEFLPTLRIGKGLPVARYLFCFWDIRPNEALIVEGPVPDSRYWSAQLYEMAWFQLVDPADRQSSLNHVQMAVDPDERVRFVVSHQDPGVANWLDAGGRRNGQLTFRWFWPRTEADYEYTTTLVPVDKVLDMLPPSTTMAESEARGATLRTRRAHLAWRFRE
jgi:hypothetical protein